MFKSSNPSLIQPVEEFSFMPWQERMHNSDHLNYSDALHTPSTGFMSNCRFYTLCLSKREQIGPIKVDKLRHIFY